MYDFYTPLMVAGEGATTPAWMSEVDFSGVTDIATSLAGIVVPVIVAVLGITIGIRMVKSMGKKIGG